MNTLKEVQDYFKANQCELLENLYINSSTKMKYRFKCNNTFYITFKYFKRIKSMKKIYLQIEMIFQKLCINLKVKH